MLLAGLTTKLSLKRLFRRSPGIPWCRAVAIASAQGSHSGDQQQVRNDLHGRPGSNRSAVLVAGSEVTPQGIETGHGRFAVHERGTKSIPRWLISQWSETKLSFSRCSLLAFLLIPRPLTPSKQRRSQRQHDTGIRGLPPLPARGDRTNLGVGPQRLKWPLFPNSSGRTSAPCGFLDSHDFSHRPRRRVGRVTRARNG